MPELCTIKTVDGVTTVHFLRSPKFDETTQLIDKLSVEKTYHLRLWDFSDVLFDFTIDETKRIATYGKSKFPEPNRAAIVAPQDLAYGKLRAFEVYREEQRHSTSRVFRTKQEATEWIEQCRGLLESLEDDSGNA